MPEPVGSFSAIKAKRMVAHGYWIRADRWDEVTYSMQLDFVHDGIGKAGPARTGGAVCGAGRVGFNLIRRTFVAVPSTFMAREEKVFCGVQAQRERSIGIP